MTAATMTAERQLVAYHEAGHAVARVAHRLAFRYATIAPDLERASLGHVRYVVPDSLEQGMFCPDGRIRNRVEGEIIASLAGGEAELRYRELAGLPTDTAALGDGGDWDHAVVLAMRYCGSPEETEAFLSWLSVRAHQFVRDVLRWSCIESVAGELVAHETLSAAKVRKVSRAAHDRMFAAIRARSGRR